MPDLGRTRLSNLDLQRARGRLEELGTTARLQLESVRVCSSGCSSDKGVSHGALWREVRVSERSAVVVPPEGGSATALSGTVFRVSERAAVVVPQEGGLNHRAR